MPYKPILATLGYVLSHDRRRVLMIHRNARDDDHHFGKYNGLGGKLEANEEVAAGIEIAGTVKRQPLPWQGAVLAVEAVQHSFSLGKRRTSDGQGKGKQRSQRESPAVQHA